MAAKVSLRPGFSARAAMDEAHRPIVELAASALGTTGTVIDLGCGNGALLRKIAEARPGVVPFGLDTDETKLEHARLLQPAFGANFVAGNMFERVPLDADTVYSLVILMPGRLLEVDESSSRRLREWLRGHFHRLLVYGYGDWLTRYEGLEGLAARAGLAFPAQVVEADLTNRDDIRRAVEGVDVVYNIAARYREAGLSAESYRAVNATAVGHLVEAARSAGARRVVQCSTVGVHGDIEHPPADEDAPIRPGDVYQETKVEGERVGAAELWRELLGVEEARPADNFFDLGGQSIQAVRLLQTLGELSGVELSLPAFFAEPTFSNLVGMIEGTCRLRGLQLRAER